MPRFVYRFSVGNGPICLCFDVIVEQKKINKKKKAVAVAKASFAPHINDHFLMTWKPSGIPDMVAFVNGNFFTEDDIIDVR